MILNVYEFKVFDENTKQNETHVWCLMKCLSYQCMIITQNCEIMNNLINI